ncbi:hypothetical protein [Vibrio sp. THAF190c]|uniref:hypothetical protein n=1 Tax=Vibrio sp. THAF190c TaxID=2587865 RepID=UPI001269041D|nr:hypothetical protein [Vibrio sp. THAF190c]QFT12988.1 hypothetical protein FIV04_23895 [Vibrio sp. THAF190c]
MDVLFWSATLFFFAFEYGLSYAFAEKSWMPDKGLATDISAAGTMWAFSYLVYFAADTVKADCKLYGQLSDYDENGCQDYAGEIETVGDVLNTTFTVNPMIAATIAFVVVSFATWLVKNRRIKK